VTAVRRRTGLVTLGLLAGTTTLALVVAQVRHLGSAQTLVLVLVSGGAPAVLYLTWAIFTQGLRDDGLGLGEAADLLATKIRSQWEAEAGRLRLNEPHLLSVPWVAADASLVDSWDNLTALAASGLGWHPPGAVSARDPSGLAGTGGQVADVLDIVPTGRLVVLGEPGAGKSILMVRLVLDLLDRREDGGSVPVLVSLASWDPVGQNLREWLAGQLSIDYPELTGPADPRASGATCLAALLGKRLITPVLDGLDEIRGDEVRATAIGKISDAIRRGERVIVTCRTDAYRNAARPEGGTGVTMLGAAGIELRPPDPLAVRRYLLAAAGPRRGRWDPVMAALGTSEPVGLALVTPLMIGLARAIFNPRPGESGDVLRDPAELCDQALAGKPDVERYLFDAFIPAAYRPLGAAHSQPWSAMQAAEYLAFLARYLDRIAGKTDIAWWELWRAAPWRWLLLGAGLAVTLTGAVLSGLGTSSHSGGFSAAVATGLTVALTVRAAGRLPRWLPAGTASAIAAGALGGLIGGILGGGLGGALISGVIGAMAVGLFVGVAGGVGGGFAGGLAGGFVCGFLSSLSGGVLGRIADGAAIGAAVSVVISVARRKVPARGANWSKAGIVFGVAVGIAVGTVVGLASTALEGLAFGIMAGIAGCIAGGLGGTPADPAAAISPRAVLIRDRRTFLGVGLATGLLAGLVTKIMAGVDPGLGRGVALWIVSVGLGLSAALVAASIQATWGTYTITRCWLALRHRLPWRLMGFLADAHERGVLRQAGAFYQFRHSELQDYLATRH
jgi:NACHT domain